MANRAMRRARGLVLPTGESAPPTNTVGVGFCHGDITPEFRRSLAFVEARDARRPDSLPYLVGEYDHGVSGAHVPDARNDIVHEFLNDPNKPEWLWCVDADASFADDVLDLLLQVADPVDRPIVGALAFGVKPKKREDGTDDFNEVMACEWEAFPTIYVLSEDGQIGIWLDYPLDALITVFSTGGHCFIVHRSVLEDERWLEDKHPQPFFRMVPNGARMMSEDQFFFIRAGSFGYPTHVHTAIKTGHVKSHVVDEELFLRQRPRAEEE